MAPPPTHRSAVVSCAPRRLPPPRLAPDSPGILRPPGGLWQVLDVRRRRRDGAATALAGVPLAPARATGAAQAADAEPAQGADLANATLTMPTGCLATEGTVSLTNGHGSVTNADGSTSFVYLRTPTAGLATSAGWSTLVPLECHYQGHGPLPHRPHPLRPAGNLLGSLDLRDVSAGAEAAIILNLTVHGGTVVVRWNNQDIGGRSASWTWGSAPSTSPGPDRASPPPASMRGNSVRHHTQAPARWSAPAARTQLSSPWLQLPPPR